MEPTQNDQVEKPSATSRVINRRDWFKLAVGGGVGLGVGGLLDLTALKAAVARFFSDNDGIVLPEFGPDVASELSH